MKYSPKELEAFIYLHLKHKISTAICEYHKELLAALVHSRIAIASPRGHAKSHICSFFYPLYLLLENPGIKILIVSATGALAEVWVAELRRELESNQSIIEFYGDQEGSEKWTNEELRLKNNSMIMAKGSGRQIRGFRPDVIIGDDLETDEMVISIEQRKKFDSWFWATLMGTLKGQEGQCVVIGTNLHPESFLAELVSKPRAGWKTRFYQAIKNNGASLWPEMWPIEVLNKRRDEMGAYAFAQEFMNDPLPDDMRTFQEKWIKYFDKEPSGCTYFTTVDPAIALGQNNDFTAIVTCAVDDQENLYVVDVINKRLLPSETIEAIFRVYKRYNSAVIAIETVGFQKMLKFEIDKQKQERKLYPVIRELSSEGKRKTLRIEALQPRFEQGKIFIKEQHEDLKTQLLRFPSPRCKDDVIDALAYQLNIIKPAHGKVSYINPNSFIATLERKRRSKVNWDSYGNHRIRGLS